MLCAEPVETVIGSKPEAHALQKVGSSCKQHFLASCADLSSSLLQTEAVTLESTT